MAFNAAFGNSQKTSEDSSADLSTEERGENVGRE
jgi:hypothetical protein